MKKTQSNNTTPAKTVAPVLEMPEALATTARILNTQYCFIEQLAQVVRIPTEARPFLDLYHPTVFCSALEARRQKAARYWMGWQERRTAYRLVYEPGQDRFTRDGNLNTWMPSKVKAVKGDITLWTDYLDRIFRTDPTYREWFLAWLAYPLQHPGTKLHTAVVFWSKQTATGKSMLGRVMSALYGAQNYAQIDDATLHNPFNFWANGRQFIMGEEIKGASSERNADRLKAMITQQVIYVNIKNKAQFELRDCLNYYFTSNHPNAFYLDPNDRRFFVHNLGDQKYPADLYRDKFEPWFLDGGAPALRYHLENEIDLAKPIIGGDPSTQTPHRFNPGAAAPQSDARKAMVLANRDDAEEWLDDLVDAPDSVLGANERTIATAPEIYEMFLARYGKSKVPYKTFCSALRARIPALYCDNKVTLTDGQKMKVYPLRVGTYAGMEEIVSTYESERG